MGRGDSLTQVEFPACGKWNIVTDGSTICAQQTAKKLAESPEGDFRHVKIPDAAASGIGFLISLPGFHFFRNLNAAQNTELVITGIAGFRQEHQPHIRVLKGDETCLLGGAAGIHSA